MSTPSEILVLQEDGLYLVDVKKATSCKPFIPFPLEYPIGEVCFLNCRGIASLTSLHQDNKTIKVWNPNPCAMYQPIVDIEMVQPAGLLTLMGFGYDPKTDDYKIVTIFDTRAYVYDCNYKRWRSIGFAAPTTGCTFGDMAATVKGNYMYWLGFKPTSYSDSVVEGIIIRFDFLNEAFIRFTTSRLPSDIGPDARVWLGIWKGDLCVFCHQPDSPHDLCVLRPAKDGVRTWLDDRLSYREKPHHRSKISGSKLLEPIKRIFRPYPRVNYSEKKKMDVRFAWSTRNDEICVLVKETNEDQGKILVYNAKVDKFIEVQFKFGNSLVGIKSIISDYTRCKTFLFGF